MVRHADAQVKLSGWELRRPLACELSSNSGWMDFASSACREACWRVSWENVVRLLAVNRLLDPGSEFRPRRQWFVDSAMERVEK